MTLIKLTEEEMVRLTELSVDGKYVSLSFGTRGVWLQAEDSPWAADLLAKWRSEARDPARL